MEKSTQIAGTLSVILALTAITVFQSSFVNAAEQEQQGSPYVVLFPKPTTVQAALQASRANGLEIESVQDTFSVGGVPTTDFYYLHGNKRDSASIVQDYRDARREMLADMRTQLKEIGSPPGARARTVAEMTASVDADVINVESVTVRGRESNVNLLASTLKGEIKNSRASKNDLSTAFLAASPAISTWAPKQGWLYTGVSSTAGQRYATNYMWWNDVSGLTANSLTTYEHDLVLNNYDGQTYFDASENIYKQPKMTYASSNLPSAYIDSRALDNRSELAYTIGSGAGASIQANTTFWYNTYFRILPGNTNADTAKVNGQLGRKDPSCIIIPFATCVFPMATTVLAPAWTHPVPGTKSWVRN